MKRDTNTIKRLIVVSVVLMFAVIIPFCLFGEHMDAFAQHWVTQAHAHPYHAAFVFATLLIGDIVLPIPSSLVSTACGIALGPLGGTIVSSLGMTISMVLGYWLMRLGTPWMRRKLGATISVRSCWWIAALRPVPVLAEASILGAGLLGLPFKRVFWIGTISNIAISTLYAYLGSFFAERTLFFFAFGVTMIISGMIMGFAAWMRNRTEDKPWHNC